ncbi:cobalamin-binding protein [Virgibacillus sp. DJP39]|uniref:cobalamin-binding protein n=1 Tax=Virgibacillus sp. DJP39 TaxID=3409790 RepID=UPI003BB56D66
MRIVSICPSNTEVVAYLGKTELLVGVDNFSDWPEEVNQLPRVGPDLSIDMDKVAKLKPDLVLASLSVPGMEKNIEALDNYGLPYIILNPNTLEEIESDIREIGSALNFPQLGSEMAKKFRHAIDEFRLNAKHRLVQPTLYWEWWPKPVFTPGGLNWLTELSALIGATNVFEEENVASFQTNWETVRKKDPDHICMVWVGVKEEKMRPELIMKRPNWDQMKAVKSGNIHVLEESLYCRPSPRLLEGLRKLESIIS